MTAAVLDPTLEAVPDLEELDAAVDAAIVAGEPGTLRVLGYGEVTLVLGWPSERPRFAIKRLPVLRDRDRADRYESVVGAYMRALQQHGVPLVPTQIRWIQSGRDRLHGYFVQPHLPRERLLNRVLRNATVEQGGALLSDLAGLIARTVDDRVGLDAQAANWHVQDDGKLAYLDLSTPLLRDETGHDRLDLDLFLSIYPWALRRALLPIGHMVIRQYHDPRTVMLDTASNLVKERLDRWLPAFLGASSRHVERPIGERETRRYFARDRRMWLTLQHLRRADRHWQRHVRRRPYPFLLPPPYHYGPPELEEEPIP
jgi:hypothetical protein